MAPVTRHTTRTTGQPLQGLLPTVRRARRQAGVQRPQRPQPPKPFQCIVCDKKFGSKIWVARHYKSHNIPYIDRVDPETGRPHREYMPAYTHPSCWTAEDNSIDRIREVTALKNQAQRRLRSSAGTTEIDEHNAARNLEQMGAVNEEDLAVKSKNRRLRMWLWWWTTQQGEVKEVAEEAGGDDFSVIGDAGRLNLGKQGLDNGYNPGVVGDPDFFDEGEDRDTVSDNTGYYNLSAYPTDDLTGSRSSNDPVPGPPRGTYDLAASFQNGQIAREAAFHFLSDVNIGFVEKNGESFDTGTIMANAAMAFAVRLSPDEDLRQDIRDYVGARRRRNAVPGSIDARRQDIDQFRSQRLNLFVYMKKAIDAFFQAHPQGDEEPRLLKRLRTYAQSLGDERAAAEANSCTNGNNVLLRQLITEKEDWRQEI